MSTYRKIHGRSIQAVTTDPSESVAEGQVWYNTTSDTFKSVVAIEAISSASPLVYTNFGGGTFGTQTAAVIAAGYSPPTNPPAHGTPYNHSQEYNGNNWSIGGDMNTARTYTFGFGLETAGVVAAGYTTTNSKLKYSTISTTAYGGINQLSLTDTGGGYLSVPGITTITSSVGNGAVLEAFSSNIGKVSKTTLENIGFDYPSDPTLLPEVLFPQVLRITPLTGFKSIGITSLGKGYIQNPNLVVLDGVTKKQITDIDLRYRPDELFVEILDNTESMNDTTPTIIPTNNSNGIRVSNLVYDNDGQHVTATIKNTFSGVVGYSGTYIDPFPFVVGDKILVENASVGVGSTASGFNSSGYDYARFEITEVTPNYGGIGTVKYDMSNYLSKNVDYPGVFDAVNSVSTCLLYTSPSPRDGLLSRMPSSA